MTKLMSAQPIPDVSDTQQFEMLLADVSARFLHATTAQLDDEIRVAQQQLCEYFNCDRSSVWQSDPGKPDSFFLTHLHQPAWGTKAPPKPEVHDYFPWAAEQLRAGRELIVDRLSDLPAEAHHDIESWTTYGTKSVLVFPMTNSGPITGILSFDTLREEREWSKSTIDRCRIVAHILSGALARKRSELTLQESECRARLMFDSAPLGMVWIDMQGQILAANSAQAKLFGYPSVDALCGHYAPLLVAERDRERSSRNLQACLQGEEVPSRTYVLVRRDGTEFKGEISSALLRDHRGDLCGYLCITRDITALVAAEEGRRQALKELSALKEQLLHENVSLRHELHTLQGESPIVGNSEPLRQALTHAKQVAATDSTVLLLGETGTGKELMAKYLHRVGRRSTKPFIATNLAAIPSTLIESELFGREKGAYTGAISKQVGRFELADGGTIFLDEIGELPMETQVKLLRVLQEGEFERLGSNRTIHVNVQVVAATNRDLVGMVRAGRFREDLYYRLNVFPITIPPLRERVEDIPLLVTAFVQEFADKMGKRIERVRRADMEKLQMLDWPGNIRELRNLVERSMILADGPLLELVHVHSKHKEITAASCSLRDVEIAHIQKVLKQTNGRIRGANGAAEILGIKAPTLYGLMERLGMEREKMPPRNRPDTDASAHGPTRE